MSCSVARIGIRLSFSFTFAATNRTFRRTEKTVGEAIKYSTIDSTLSLSVALFVNAAILVVSAAAFHRNGYATVGTLEDAYHLLEPLLHSQAAPICLDLRFLLRAKTQLSRGP